MHMSHHLVALPWFLPNLENNQLHGYQIWGGVLPCRYQGVFVNNRLYVMIEHTKIIV